MFSLIVIVHVIVCVALVIIVLLQAGKGAEIGAAFGGASQTIFGSTGSGGFMSKLTTGAAIIFMVTCLTLSYIAAHSSSTSVLTEGRKRGAASQPLPPPSRTVPSAPAQQGGIPQPSPVAPN